MIPASLPRSGFALLALTAFVPPALADFEISPPQVALQGNFARAQLLVTARPGGEHAADLTHQAGYSSSRPEVATVSPTGQVLARGDGEANVIVTLAGVSHAVAVKVTGVLTEPAITFTGQIMPILAKAGCTAGACHAAQYGQGGFKLSVFASYPGNDYLAIVRNDQSRRVNFLDPTRSLLLLKPTGIVPHGGGRRLEAGSVDYQILERWIAAGAPQNAGKPAEVTGLEVYPKRRAGAGEFTQQLRAIASYSDGTTRDVTGWGKFDALDEGVLRVSPQGRVEVFGRGQGAVMVRFEGRAAIMQAVVPFAPVMDLPGWTDQNYIDRHASAKFRQLGLKPAPLCDDATFLRRVFLNGVGTLPTVEQARAFLDSKDPDKRRKLIDQVLGLTGDPAQDVHNNSYAAWWALKWADLLRSKSLSLTEQGMWAMNNWLQGAFRDNMRFDRFVRELITAKGFTLGNGPTNFYAAFGNPDDRTEAVGQVFMGVRLQCAKCHHHPFETISQADYYGLAAYFVRVGTKYNMDWGVRHYNGDVVVLSKGDVTHPKTGAVMQPTPLRGKPGPTKIDRRQALADWLVAPDNPYFARNIVNRYWAHLMGRGLVEQIDDMRDTNPPTNPELLDALAQDFVKNGYDVKRLLRSIMNSRLFQLDSNPPQPSAPDRLHYSHYLVKRVPAEPLLDAIDSATGVATKFVGVPMGTRAIELPDANYDNYLLKTFGKPERKGVCECERVADPNLAQALHTLNSDIIIAKIANPKGRVAQLVAARKPETEIVANIYLAALSRYPTDAEQAACRKLAAEAPEAIVFYEDLLWSLMNTKQFLFVR